MKNPPLYFRYFGFVIAMLLIVGCQKTDAFPTAMLTTTIKPTKTHQITAMPTVMLTLTATSNIAPKAQFKSQCLTVTPILPNKITSNGIVVLESRVTMNGRINRESYLRNMMTGETLHLEHARNFIISPDRTLMAYRYVMLDSQDQTLKDDLVIADVSGHSLKVLPWQNEWSYALGWFNNQRLMFSLQENHGVGKPYTLQVLNPFNGEQQLLHPDFPDFLNTPNTKLPYWEGQLGVIYDPTLTRVIYPRFIGDNQEMYTYALWDIPNQKLVTSLENIFSAQSIYNDMFPMPHWSPNGSQFVFSGVIRASEKDGKSSHLVNELYQVSHDGQITQLTHLDPYAGVLDPISWSPNGRYLAGFLVSVDTPAQQALVTLIDTSTLDVINYCIPVYYDGGDIQPISPIWSPDGKQFLISDKDEANHWHVILVDIEKGTAAQIATDMNAVGWMTKEP